MRLLGRDRIEKFVRKHPDARPSLRSWAQTIESNNFRYLVELKRTFGTADYVRPHTVFDIAGNKYRLIALVDYPLQSVTVEHVLTHDDYAKGRWRE